MRAEDVVLRKLYAGELSSAFACVFAAAIIISISPAFRMCCDNDIFMNLDNRLLIVTLV